jgi:hypothetical protein
MQAGLGMATRRGAARAPESAAASRTTRAEGQRERVHGQLALVLFQEAERLHGQARPARAAGPRGVLPRRHACAPRTTRLLKPGAGARSAVRAPAQRQRPVGPAGARRTRVRPCSAPAGAGERAGTHAWHTQGGCGRAAAHALRAAVISAARRRRKPGVIGSLHRRAQSRCPRRRRTSLRPRPYQGMSLPQPGLPCLQPSSPPAGLGTHQRSAAWLHKRQPHAKPTLPARRLKPMRTRPHKTRPVAGSGLSRPVAGPATP